MDHSIDQAEGGPEEGDVIAQIVEDVIADIAMDDAEGAPLSNRR